MYDQIFFAHIPKTAGTSLYAAARTRFPDQEMIYGIHALNLARMPAEDLASKRYIHGHFSLGMSERLGEKCFRFMFFREPRSRILSLYNFWRSAHFRYPEFYREGTAPFRVAHQTFNEFISDEANLPDIANAQARYLCGDTVDMSANFDVEDMRKRLASLNVAGTSERFADSVRVLNYKLGMAIFSSAEMANVTGTVTEFQPLRAADLSSGEIGRLDALLDLDHRVYELAAARVDRDVTDVAALPVKLSFFGDSHINAVKLLDHNLSNENYVSKEHSFQQQNSEFRVRFFGSASATGLNNEKSKTRVSTEVPRYMAADVKDGFRSFVFHFGKVDLDFVLPYRALKHGIPDIGAFLDRSIQSYEQFLISLKTTFPQARLIVLGLTPPTLHASEMLRFVRDESVLIDVAQNAGESQDQAIPNDRQIIDMIGSRECRTELCEAFNSRLSNVCTNLGVSFVDIFHDAIDQSSGQIRDSLLNPDPDHHAMPGPMSRLIKSHIETLY